MKNISDSKSLIIALVTGVLILCSCGSKQEKSWNIEKVEHTINCNIPNAMSNEDIAIADTTVSIIINSYLKTLYENIKPYYIDSLYLNSDSGIKSTIIYSTISELIIILEPNKRNSLNILCTLYPAQMALFAGHDLRESPIEWKGTYQEAIDAYINFPACFSFGYVHDIYFTHSSFNSRMPKLIEFAPGSWIIIRDLTFEFVAKNIVDTTKLEGWAILFKDNGINRITSEASYFGQIIASKEITELTIKSEFFKKSLADDRLNSKSKEIKRNSESNKTYEFWEYQKDYKELCSLALACGYNKSEIVEIIEFNQRCTGNFLWFYRNCDGFLWQWSILNAFLFILLIIIISCRWLFNILLGYRYLMKYWLNSSIIIMINIIIFEKFKPIELTILGCIIPGILLVFCIIAIIYIEIKMRGKENSRNI